MGDPVSAADARAALRAEALAILEESEGCVPGDQSDGTGLARALLRHLDEAPDRDLAAAWRAGYEFCRESVREENGDGWLNGTRGAYPMVILPNETKIETALAEFLAKNGAKP
jgi:hypothetical protein